MSNYWFKPKTHGYGATPTGWKGWALITVFGSLLVAMPLALIVWPSRAGNPPSTATIIVLGLALTAITIGFLLFTRLKTDGAWRWRWGDQEKPVDDRRKLR